MSLPDPEPDLRIERLPDVVARTGLSRTIVYDLVAASLFPRPVRLSARRVGWLAHEVDAWIATRPRTERDGVNCAHQPGGVTGHIPGHAEAGPTRNRRPARVSGRR